MVIERRIFVEFNEILTPPFTPSLLTDALPVWNRFHFGGASCGRFGGGLLAVGKSLAAVLLRGTDASVPAVDAYLGRPVAQVVAHAALAIFVARLAEAHRVREMFPWKPSEIP